MVSVEGVEAMLAVKVEAMLSVEKVEAMLSVERGGGHVDSEGGGHVGSEGGGHVECGEEWRPCWQ